ncbi:white protein [Phytophthora cinnamomi]|uniref:white protein n=1 Tax=Phytophthora cinnamomi TaxID=4785 RepID=UPI0035593DB0|nr:white protein [Phytophthora cinnamomi]
MSSSLVKLREAMAACVAVTTTSKPVFELMTLWSVVHEAVNDAFIEKAEKLIKLTAASAVETLNAKAIGELLAAAISSSTELASAISHGLQGEIQALAETGTPLAAEVSTELQQHLRAIHDTLSSEDWADLCSRLTDSTTKQWENLAEAATKVVDSATEEIGVVTAEAIKVYNSPLGKAIISQGLSGLDGVFAQSREAIDAALDTLRSGEIATVGTIAAILARAGLPPLLRLEIARDYFQTVGLFFGGLYAAALDYIDEHHIATQMSRFLNGVSSIYDVVSINVVAVVKGASLSHQLMIDIAMWLLIAAVAAVYLSYVWFAVFGRRLHSRRDEVRQGHEADSWADLATKQKTRVALFTYVITACLTIYLPLTRLCLEIVVEAATHRLLRAGNYSGYTGNAGSNGNTGTSTGYAGSSGNAYGGYNGGASSYSGGTTTTTTTTGGSSGGYYNSFKNGTEFGSSYDGYFSGVNTSSSFDIDRNFSFAALNDSSSSGIIGLMNSSSDFDSSVVTVTAFTTSNDYSSAGNSASELVLNRWEGTQPAWDIIIAIAILLLVTFTLQLPKILVGTITDNRPTGSLENAKVTYDVDGEEVPFDDKVYERLVTRDPNQLRCPYRSLYAGFEQRWSYYKVLQLLIKLVLALVIVLTAADSIVLRGIILVTFYAVVVGLTCYSTPFIDPLNNVMEISGKLTALTTCIGGLVAVNGNLDMAPSHTLEIVAIVVSTAHIINFFVMLVVILLGMPGARLTVKNVLGWLTFSDTCRGIDDAPAKNVLPLWELEREAKHRVWHGFWRALLLEVAQNSSEPTEDSKGMNIVDRSRRLLGRRHGTRDGHLDSNTCFGKMYVVPYPFHCVVVYDDCNDETIIRDDIDSTKGDSKLAKLLFLNFTARIMAKRELRQKLRVLSDHATRINFPFSRQERVTVPDGYIQTTDQNGNTQTTPRFTTVTFTCYYTNGVIGVGTKGDEKGRIMAEGFDVTMTYRDGHGKAIAPHTGMVFEQSGRVAVMKESHIGLTSTMLESKELTTIFEQTREVWETGVPELREKHQQYRRGLQIKHTQANATLTDSFWYFVYNNSHLSREKLEDHFRYREANPRLKLLAETHQTALDSLYLQMRFIHSHPAVTFWYIFWDDVYTRNGDMKCFRNYIQDLDPHQPTAICYHVMRRHDLEVWLRERKLLGTRRLFHTLLLDVLYEEMDKHLENTKVES